MYLDLFKKKLRDEFGDIYTAKYPKRRIFKKMRKDLNGMTSENMMMLLQVAGRCLSKEHTYLEVGCYRGCTGCAAMSGTRGKNFVFVDNFSEFDKEGINRSILLANLRQYRNRNQYKFFEKDFRDAIEDEEFRRTIGQVGVYLYDGAHDFNSQIQGLTMPYHYLSKNALVIVDDINMPAAQDADNHLIRAGMFDLVYRFRSPKNGYLPGWWNGVDVLIKR